MTDEKIAEGIISRDERALDALIDKYGGLIKSIVTYHLHENYRGECMNDILLSLWRNMDRYDPEKNSLKNWIGAVCKYKCIDYKRKYYNENFSELDERIPSPMSAESGIIRAELEAEIDELLQSLPERDREIFRRRYIDGESVELISAETGMKSSAVYNRLSRGRRRLKNILIRSENDEKRI